MRRLARTCHGCALECYDTVGECWYPAQFYARAMPMIRFYPAVLDERGDPQEEESGVLADLWERVQDPGGGRAELTGSYGRLMFLTGDGYLIESVEDDEIAFEFVSPLELRTLPEGGYQRLRAPGLGWEDLMEAPDEAFDLAIDEAKVWRLYRRHPAFSMWSDSPVRAVLDLYELIKLLTLAAGAEAQSRAASRGLLYIPEELSFASPDSDTGDEDPQADQFLQEIQEMLVANIKDPGSAGAMSPLVLRGQGLVQTGAGTFLPMVDLIKWFPLGPDDSYKAVDAWEKVIGRIASGLDMPAENVTGTGDVNHWGGWLLDEQGYRQHIAPVAQKFADDMAAAYLRPMARAEGFADWERVVIGIDPTEAINHPDESTTSLDGWREGLVSSQFVRERIGATEDDAPTDEDLELVLALHGKPIPIEEEDEEGENSPTEGGTGNDTDEDTPPPEDAPGPSRSAQTAAAAFKIIGASESAVNRIREKAGARLVSRSQGCEPCREKIAGVPLSLVASALGMDQVRNLVATETELVAGGADSLAETITRWGVGGEWTGELGKMVEAHAIRTLYEEEPPPLPAGFAAVVSRALMS